MLSGASGVTKLPTFKEAIAGDLTRGHDNVEAEEVVYKLSFYANLFFILGYEVYSSHALINLVLEEPVTNDTVFEGEVFSLHGSSGYHHKIAHNKALGCIQKTIYVTINNSVVVKKDTYFIGDENDYKTIVAEYNSESLKKYASETDFFNEFKDESESGFFKLPIKQEPNLERFPLKTPSQIFEIGTFFENPIEINKFYFFANTTPENPLDWQVAFISSADERESSYAYSKIIELKDFNKTAYKPKEIELRYSDDINRFIRKQKKEFNKAGLKAIDTKIIIKILTGKTVEELNEQMLTTSFVINSNFIKVVEVYENYACIRDDSLNHLYWQFFKDQNEVDVWLNTYKTTETKIYSNVRDYINKHTSKYLANNDVATITIKKQYLENPLLNEYLNEQYVNLKFNNAELVLTEAIYSEKDYMFSSINQLWQEYKIIVIEGDVIVDGTLAFLENRNNFIIIKGNLEATNLVVIPNFEFLFVEGAITIKNIAKSGPGVICENANTNILLHRQENIIDLTRNLKYVGCNFKYNHEVYVKSKAIINKEVITTGGIISSLTEWDEAKLIAFLTENKPFLADTIESTKIDKGEYHKAKYEKRMQDFGYFYPEYAGCELLSISEDNQIKGRKILPGAGDWVVNDLRGKSGTYGVSHEDFSIHKLKVKYPEEFNIDYSQKPLKLTVSAETLMERYQQIAMLFLSWEHRKTASFSEDASTTNEAYEKEKKEFLNDPHLALYWLNHFGLTLDKRFQEVVSIIEKHNLIDALPVLKEPLTFFKETDAFYSVKVSVNEDLFLIRRAYLVYWEQSYKNYNPDNLDLWWKSVCIYPKIEENLIVRMRWLKNNLKKCNNWTDFEALIKNENQNIPLLSYVFAVNPNTNAEEKTKYADVLVSELLEHKNYFNSPHKKQFGEILLWDVRETISDKENFSKAVSFYYKGNKTSKEYIDIQVVLGIENPNTGAVESILKKLDEIYRAYDRSGISEETHVSIQENIALVLETLSPEVLLETTSNIQSRELARLVFVCLWKLNIANKKEALVQLFVFSEFSSHNIDSELFGASFPKLLKDENDPNIEIAKAFVNIPEADFRNTYMWERSKQAATKFFLSVAHLPKVFHYLIDTVSQVPTKENLPISEAIYATLFSEEYESKINPTLKFSKAQIELMLTTICNGFLEHDFNAEAESAIYYCSNPLAKEWITEKRNNKKWLKQFADNCEGSDEELKNTFNSALELITNEELNTYLEYKDEKSHKFWKITFYENEFIVQYGKIGTVGKKSEKVFDTTEACHKAGRKLIAQKFKKGYKQ